MSMKCDACDELVEEDEVVRGYLAPDSILCRPCYDYLDNEVFSGDDQSGRKVLDD